MLVGDSITEFAYVPDLCGKPVLNAGLAGSQVGDWERRLPAMLTAAKPSIVIFALGINDAKRGSSAKPRAWRQSYQSLIAQVREAKIAIVGVQHVEPGKAKSSFYDEALGRELDNNARALAGQLGATFIAPLPNIAGKTSDGIHLNDVGRREWVERLNLAC